MLQPISIHTPAKGVTASACVRGSTSVISIHTPAKGVTRSGRRVSSSLQNFNPHSREGSDVEENRFYKRQYYFNPHSREGSDCQKSQTLGCRQISIHTPAKGVTRCIYCTSNPVRFQSTLPRRE